MKKVLFFDELLSRYFVKTLDAAGKVVAVSVAYRTLAQGEAALASSGDDGIFLGKTSNN